MTRSETAPNWRVAEAGCDFAERADCVLFWVILERREQQLSIEREFSREQWSLWGADLLFRLREGRVTGPALLSAIIA